jgi:hypothetical protein
MPLVGLDDNDQILVSRVNPEGVGEQGSATLLAVRGWAADSKTGDYTAGFDDEAILVDASAGAVTITLPPVADYNGKYYKIKKIDTTSLSVTIDGNGATIDRGATAVITSPYVSLTVQCDGTEWWIV